MFQYTPVEGFRDVTSFPDPSTEAEARDQIQSLLDQAATEINNRATRDEVQGIVLGQVPDGTITPVKLSFDPATQAELDAVSNNVNNLSNSIDSKTVGSKLYAYSNLGGAL